MRLARPQSLYHRWRAALGALRPREECLPRRSQHGTPPATFRPLLDGVAENAGQRNACRNNDVPENETTDEIADGEDVLDGSQIKVEKVGQEPGAKARYESDDEIANCPHDTGPGESDFECTYRVHVIFH